MAPQGQFRVSTLCRTILAASLVCRTAAQIWQPAVGSSWQIVLQTTIDETPPEVDVYIFDLFDNSASTISSIQENGGKVICYFSGGSWEDWRPDADQFSEADMGDGLDGWAGERWLDLRSENVREIMGDRLELAVEKGCDGVDPDNVDGFDNQNGIDLTAEDSINYVNYLAKEAHSRGLSIGLKNAGSIVPDVIENMEWCVNEQCHRYSECGDFAAFVEAGKPVFHIEYPKCDHDGAPQDCADVPPGNPVSEEKARVICDNPGSQGFSTLLKNMDLGAWYQRCPPSER